MPCRCSQDASDRCALRPAGRHERQHGESRARCWASPGGPGSPPTNQPAGLGLGRLCQCQAGAVPAWDLPGSSPASRSIIHSSKHFPSPSSSQLRGPSVIQRALGQWHVAERGRGEMSPAPSPSPSPTPSLCLLTAPLAAPCRSVPPHGLGCCSLISGSSRAWPGEGSAAARGGSSC